MVLDIGGDPLPNLREDGRLARSELLDECFAYEDLRVNPFAVLEVVRQGGIHIRESDTRVVIDDFVWAHARPLVPNGHIRDRDAVPVDARPTGTDPGCADDAHPVRGWDVRCRCLAARVVSGAGCFHEFHGTAGLAP